MEHGGISNLDNQITTTRNPYARTIATKFSRISTRSWTLSMVSQLYPCIRQGCCLYHYDMWIVLPVRLWVPRNVDHDQFDEWLTRPQPVMARSLIRLPSRGRRTISYGTANCSVFEAGYPTTSADIFTRETGRISPMR